MRGQIEVLANQTETADKRQKDLYLDIDTRLSKLEQAREQQAAVPEKPPAPAPAAEAEPSPGEAKAYQAALDQFKLGNTRSPSRRCRGSSSPTRAARSPPTRSTGSAWRTPASATTRARSPRSASCSPPGPKPKAPDAMLSIASAQETMGDRERAEDAPRADREVPGEQLRGQREAAPRRVRQALSVPGLQPRHPAPGLIKSAPFRSKSLRKEWAVSSAGRAADF